jgi:molybdate transport repressor ModE-like protein
MPLAEPVPDIRSLDLLQSVAELGSIRQAALAHNISQPAASMRLRSLERTLNLQLLDRSGGRARLTPTGMAVVQWSTEVLEAMQTLLIGTAAALSTSCQLGSIGCELPTHGSSFRSRWATRNMWSRC